MGRLSELIDEVSNTARPLGDVLLKARVFAHKLKGRKFRQWVKSETEGYPDGAPLPDYRVIETQCFGDYHGPFGSAYTNVPLSTSMLAPDIQRCLDTQRVAESISTIEEMLRLSDKEFGIALDINLVAYLRRHGMQARNMVLNYVVKRFSPAAFSSILSMTRARLLDFLLELSDKHPELDDSEGAAAELDASEIDAVAEKHIYHNCTVVKDSQMRDAYSAGQAAAMGPNATAEGNTFIQVLRDAIGESSLLDLATELETLRSAMLAEAKSSGQDEAVAAVAQAEEAAKKGDAKGVLSWLKAAGKWSFDVATKIGTSVAAKAIEKSMIG